MLSAFSSANFDSLYCNNMNPDQSDQKVTYKQTTMPDFLMELSYAVENKL